MTKDELERLEKLAGEATAAGWKLCHHLQSAEKDASCPCGYRGGIWGPDGEHLVCEMGSTVTPGEEALTIPRYERRVELANAALIVAAVNALPDLIRLARIGKALEDGTEVYVRGIRVHVPKGEPGDF